MKFFINRYRHKALKSVCFIGLISLVMHTACSSGGEVAGEEPTPTPGNPPTPQPTETAITFKSGLAEGEEVTRSTGLEEATTTFTVWSYKNMSYDDTNGYGGLQTVMPGYTVNYGANTAMTTTSNTNDWEYVGMGQDQTIKYWDWSALAYRFFGVANADDDDTTYTPNSPNGPYSITFEDVDATTSNLTTLPYFSTLWFSNGNPTTYPDRQFGKSVTLVFVQPYCRVRFMFTFVYPDRGITVTDKHFAPTDDTKKIHRRGDVTVSYPLIGTGIRETYTVTPNNDNDPAVSKVLDALTQNYYEVDDDETDLELITNARKWYYVLPAFDQGTYTLSIKVNGEDRSAVVPAEYMTWSPGYQYTYIFKITDEGGVELDLVSSAFTDWNEVNSNDHEVYNW